MEFSVVILFVIKGGFLLVVNNFKLLINLLIF